MIRRSPVIIQAAITGSLTTPAEHPGLPVTVEQNVRAAIECWHAGASVIALHAREDDGTPTQDASKYAEIVDGIRKAGCDAILNISTGSAGGRVSGPARYACLEVDAEMATFDAGSVNMGDRVFENSLPFLRDLASACSERGVKPEIECFESGHIQNALLLRDEGLLHDPLHFQFVLGIRGGSSASASQLAHMKSLLPHSATWSACAVGASQLPINALSILLGGHVRTGLEDNIFYRRGDLATNEQLVSRIVRLVEELNYTTASVGQARQLLNISMS